MNAPLPNLEGAPQGNQASVAATTMAIESVNETYQQYLAALGFRPDDFVCVSLITASGCKDYFQQFASLSTPSSIQRLTARNEKGENVFVCMAPLKAGTASRKKEFVIGVRHCWVDADENGDAILERITADVNASILPEPALVVQTSPGKVQVIWRLDSTDFDVARQELLLSTLQNYYGTDPAVTDTNRVLRMAGFKNNKYESKPLATILYVGPAGQYKFSDFKIEPAPRAIKTPPTINGDVIPRGQHDDYLHRLAGKLRNDGMEEEAIYNTLVEVTEKRLDDFGSDYLEMCRKHAHNICKHPPGNPLAYVIVDGKVAGSESQLAPAASSVAPAAPPAIDTTGLCTYPEFPTFVMRDTTIYEGLVKPASEMSSKYPELIWLPAVQLALNHMFGRVRIKDQKVNLNMYLGLISPYGKFFKSSSCELAHEYFATMGLAATHKPSMRNADGKMVIMQAGSTEGFGRTLAKMNGTHAVLYNEELSKMVSKANIESASYAHDLLTWYGSGDFGNNVVSERNSFSFPAGTYCFSWQFCTTDRGFNRQWPLIAGIASGMVDRMFFLLSPKEPRPTTPYKDPFLPDAAAKTRKVLAEAVEQGVYAFEDIDSAIRLLSGMDPRSMQLVQMLALYFAVDLQEGGERLIEITPECLERAQALVEYRNAVHKYLEPIEADNAQGRIQKEILREIKQAGGKMKYRDLCRAMDYGRFGSDVWKYATAGMLKIDPPMMVEWEEKTAKGRTVHMVGIPRQEED